MLPNKWYLLKRMTSKHKLATSERYFCFENSELSQVVRRIYLSEEWACDRSILWTVEILRHPYNIAFKQFFLKIDRYSYIN